ncbi:MAG: hypothetical protein ACFBQW_01360 [Sphingomonadaceae bacterium]
MKRAADYDAKGYAHLEGFLPPEVADAFLQQLELDLREAGKSFQQFATSEKILARPAIQIYGYRYKPMISFLWGMTPAMIEVTGRDLLPTYCFFRIYQEGDICRVHSDRGACEHSLSLTLAYSDGKPWPLQIAAAPVSEARPIADGFDADDCSAVPMRPGDAVLYKGVQYRHGRTVPNPNRWSAHLFLHWVDRDGPYRDCAFDARLAPADRPAAG